MFNLFGSLFFGRSATATEEESAVNTTGQNQSQLMVTSQPHDEDFLQRQWVIVEKRPMQSTMATSTTQLEEAVARESQQEKQQQPLDVQSEPVDMSVVDKSQDTDEVLLGSFFDRNECDDTAKPAESLATETIAAPRDEWLITPLPCLTSITCSQRSLVDNDPLENLLIEHPSMSVFVSVENKSEFLRKEVSLTSTESLPAQQQCTQKKRKEMDSTSSQQQPALQLSPPRNKAKPSKRNKKSTSTGSASPQLTHCPSATNVTASGANKENMAVRTLLTSEFRSKANPATKLDTILLSKNQMKRNNKQQFGKFNSINCIQRKFHKLQQPVCC